MNYKITDKELLKIRTQGTVDMVLRDILGQDLDLLLADIFVNTDNPMAKELIMKYENQLVFAYSNPNLFREKLHKFFMDTAYYIKENNLYREFLSFFYFIFSTFSIKDTINSNKSVFAYYDLLCQQIQYFSPQLSKIVGGLKSNGKPLLTNDPFPYIDVPRILSSRLKTYSFEEEIKIHKMYGYYIHVGQDIINNGMIDQVVTNSVMIMANFINEDTAHLIPKKFNNILKGINIPDIITSTETFREVLKSKRYLLPRTGVKALYKGCRDIKEVYYQEVFAENRVVLLFKVTDVADKEFYGFYDNKLSLFYSPFNDISPNHFSEQIENFILENYAYLTTDIEDLSISKRFLITSNIDNVLMTTSYVQYLMDSYKYTNENGNKKNLKKEYKNFSKQEYKNYIKSIMPFKRKLPTGAKASEEAIELARQYGYIVNEGETFVRPFKKNIYVK